MIRVQLLAILLCLCTSINGAVALNNVIFKRVYEGQLVDEEELFVESFLHAYRDIPLSILKTNDPEGRLRHFFNYERIELNDGQKEIYFIRAEYENSLIGFVSFEVCKEPGMVYIREMAIAPAYKRCGLGKKLVFLCTEYMPDVQRIVLATTQFNQNAIDFYTHIGFKRTEAVPHGLDPELFIGLEYQ